MTEKPHAGHGDDHGHDHHGSPWIQHHYDDAQHQFDSGKLGIWLFLAQEVLFFSALFVAYILYRHHHPEIYAYAHKYLDTKMGAINTGVLIFSSLTAAWAVRAAQLRQQKLLVACLATTIACACGFLVIKYFEYTHKIHEQILFGPKFDPCVSSGGTSLLTKSNDCPGTKTTVLWNVKTNAPAAGSCFGDIAIDSDPARPHVQPNCKVFEATGTYGLDKDGNPIFTEQSRKEVTTRCFDAAFGRTGGIDGMPSSGDKQAGQKYPCWKPNHQPHVCKGGFFFASKDSVGGMGPYATAQACSEARKGAGDKAIGECVPSHASGFLIEYGDHEHRDNVRVLVECAPPAPINTAIDLDATAKNELRLGEAAVAKEPPPTKHELKDALYAGPPPEHTSMFFTIYFAMTGLHGIHVLVGFFVFIWLLLRAMKGHFTPDYFGPIDFAALYWHIVDLIWIFLFPLLYLIH